jgi:hypothetical protein
VCEVRPSVLTLTQRGEVEYDTGGDMGGEVWPGKKKKAGAASVGASFARPNENAALAMEQMAQQLQAMMGELGANAGVCTHQESWGWGFGASLYTTLRAYVGSDHISTTSTRDGFHAGRHRELRQGGPKATAAGWEEGLVYYLTRGKWDGYRHVYSHTHYARTSSHQRVLCSLRFTEPTETDCSTVGFAACGVQRARRMQARREAKILKP